MGKSYVSLFANVTNRRGRLPDIKILKRLYFDKEMSLNDIADKYRVSYSAVQSRFKKHGITLRDSKTGYLLAVKKRRR